MLLSVLFSLKIVARLYAWLGSDLSVSQITSRCHQDNQRVIRFLVVTYVFYIHPTQLYCLLLQVQRWGRGTVVYIIMWDWNLSAIDSTFLSFYNGLDCCTHVTAFSGFLFFFQGKDVFFVGNLAHFYCVSRLLELLLSLKPKLIWSCHQGAVGVVESIAGLTN